MSFLELVLAVALVPTMISFVTAGNFTGTDAILMGLVVTVVEIMIIYHAYTGLSS